MSPSKDTDRSGDKKKKRRRDEDGEQDGDGGAGTSGKGAASIGQLTGHIRNKQKREELYAKLKHQQNVSRWPLALEGGLPPPRVCCPPAARPRASALAASCLA